MHKYGDWRDGSSFAAYLWAIWETVPGKLSVLCLMLLVLLSGGGMLRSSNEKKMDYIKSHDCKLDRHIPRESMWSEVHEKVIEYPPSDMYSCKGLDSEILVDSKTPAK